MKVQQIEHDEADFPAVLYDRLDDGAPRCLYALCDTTIMGNRLLGLVCSIRCPGSIVIKTFDVIREVRDAGVVVIGGFHSPMERQCLDILLRGNQPVVFCAAKGLSGLRLGGDARRAVRENRLAIRPKHPSNNGPSGRAAERPGGCVGRCGVGAARGSRWQDVDNNPPRLRSGPNGLHLRRQGELRVD
jgi:hypothetical protein